VSDVTEAIVAERAGVLALARRQCGQIDALTARGTMTGGEATLLKERLRGFADQVAAGLHVQTEDDRAVRAAMRAVVQREQADG
jgi:hypothetical protein